MTQAELLEVLADKEHASWARWMAYLFSRCQRLESGDFVITRSDVRHWQRQIDTPYAELSDSEKESDRKEVREILTIIEAYKEQAHD